MSLQVWLPLNGDLHNQGLDPVIFSKTTENVWGSGKIGEKALLTSTGTKKTMVNGLKNKQKFSIAFWVKVDATLNFTNWQDIWALEYTNSTGTGPIRFEHASTAGNCQLIVYKEKNVGENTNEYCGVRGAQNYSDNWYHITLTKNQDNTKCYINGNLTNTIFNNQYEASLGKLTGNVTIGASTCAAYLNDVRIYDHCLSPKEVEEIAKGLVLHYPLNNNGLGNTNLALNTFYEMHSYTIPSYYIRTDNTSTDFFNLSIGDTYTCRAKITAGEKDICLRIQFYTDNNTRTSIFGNWVPAGTTGYSTITSTLTAEQRNYFQMEILLSDGVNASTSGEYGELKLEKGSIATSWCPNNINTNIIYDTSGYCNNGTIVGDITTITPSPRYNCATKLNSTKIDQGSTGSGAAYIVGDISLTEPSQISISWWINGQESYNNRTGQFNNGVWSTSMTDASDYSASAFNHRDNAFDINSSDGIKKRLTADILTDNQWSYYALVYDGQIATLYKNGNIKYAISFDEPKTLGSFIKIFIGFSKAGGVYRKVIATYSDFRIYCTALSANQVKELYNTSMQIDSSGNVFARKLVEL